MKGHRARAPRETEQSAAICNSRDREKLSAALLAGGDSTAAIAKHSLTYPLRVIQIQSDESYGIHRLTSWLADATSIFFGENLIQLGTSDACGHTATSFPVSALHTRMCRSLHPDRMNLPSGVSVASSGCLHPALPCLPCTSPYP